MNKEYKNKYLKYKNKYYNLNKNKLVGGSNVYLPTLIISGIAIPLISALAFLASKNDVKVNIIDTLSEQDNVVVDNEEAGNNVTATSHDAPIHVLHAASLPAASHSGHPAASHSGHPAASHSGHPAASHSGPLAAPLPDRLPIGTVPQSILNIDCKECRKNKK